MATVHYVVTPDGTVRRYKGVGQAEGAMIELFKDGVYAASDKGATTPDVLKNIPTPLLVKLHNLIRPERPVNKFQDRATAEKRMQGVLEVLAIDGETPTAPAEGAPQENDMGTTAKPGARKRSPAKKTAASEPGAGRPSAFAGKKIQKLADKNPRREGTAGYKSWEKIRNGMTYEQYLEAGGRRQDLAWDIEHKYVKLVSA